MRADRRTEESEAADVGRQPDRPTAGPDLSSAPAQPRAPVSLRGVLGLQRAVGNRAATHVVQRVAAPPRDARLSAPVPATAGAAGGQAVIPDPAPAADVAPVAPGSAGTTTSGGRQTAAGDQAGAGTPAAPGEAGGFEQLLGEITTHQAELLADERRRHQQVDAAALAQQGRHRQAVEAEAVRVEGAHDAAVEAINGKAAADRTAVGSALDSQLTRVDGAAAAELDRLAAAVTAQEEALRGAGQRRQQGAVALGTDEATRAEQGTADRRRQAGALADRKAAQYSAGDKGAEIVRSIRSETATLLGRITETGTQVAGRVRQLAADLGARIVREAGDGVRQLGRPRADAAARIGAERDRTKDTLRRIAREATGKIEESRAKAAGELRAGKAAQAAKVRAAAGVVDELVDRGSRQAKEHASQQARSVSAELAGVGAQLRPGGWYPSFVARAQSQLTEALATHRGQEDGHVSEVTQGFGTLVSAATAELTGQVGESVDAVTEAVRTARDGTGKLAEAAVTQLGESAGTGEQGIRAVAPATERALQDAVTRIDTRWGEQLEQRRTDLRDQVDAALGHEDRAVASFGAGIDTRAARAQAGGGVLSAIWDFVVGTFEGLALGAWDLLKALWAGMKTFLFWAVVIGVVIVLALIVVGLVLGLGMTVGAAIAAVGKVLLIIGVVVGVLVAGYYLYRMITAKGLSWRERGQLFGRALFELILALAGTGVLKRLGVLTEVGRLAELVERVGGVARALRLIHLVPDLDKLFVLLDRVGDAEKLVLLLEKVRDVELLVRLLDAVGDLDKLITLLDRVKDAGRLTRLIDQVGNVEKLIELLRNTKLADAAVLERLLGNAKIADVAVLERLLGNPKIVDGVQLERLLGNAKVSDVAALERLLANAKITDGALLERTLGNAKVGDVAQLERLLANVKLTDVATLERFLADQKLQDAAQLERLLASTKVTDGAELERMLALSDSGARLESLLGLTDTPAQLVEYLVNAGGSRGVANLERLLLGIGLLKGPNSAARAQQILAQANGDAGKLSEYLEWINRLAGRTAPPAVAAPPEVAALGFTGGANMPHFLDGHMWEFLDIQSRTSKASTTLWPPGTAVSRVRTALGEALTALNPRGGAALPVPGTPSTVTVSGVAVQVGSQVTGAGPRIGQFFPTAAGGDFITIVRAEMRALWEIFR